MKKIIIALSFFIGIQQTIFAQKQKVYSIIKQHHTVDWYETQLSLWQKEVKSNPKDAEAWLNVYTAARMIKISGGNKTQKDLDEIEEEVKKNIPETFEGNYIQYYNANFDSKKFEFLKKAYEIDPNRPETFDDFATHFELKRDKVKTKEFCEKIFASNDYSSGLYAYSYNTLMSCEENGILITVGDNDTYPALILQNVKGIRTDVAVMNVFMLTDQNYRSLYFKELGIPDFKPEKEDLKMNEFVKALCKHIRTHSKRPFYYVGNAPVEYYSDVENDVYSVGLAYKYSETNFDNVAVMRKNVENDFILDHLKITLLEDISQSVVDHMSGNYLIPFFILYNHYKHSEELQKLKKITELIEIVAERSGQTEQVEEILNKK